MASGKKFSLITGAPNLVPVFNQDWISYGLVIVGNGSKTFTAAYLKYKQHLNGIRIAFQLQGNNVASGAGSTNLTFALPSGMLTDSTYLAGTIGADSNDAGWGYEAGIQTTGAYAPLAAIIPFSSTIGFLRSGSGSIVNTADLNFARNMTLSGEIWVPIQGMSAYLVQGAGRANANLPGIVPPRKEQYDLTVTSNAAGWVTARAKGIYYQDQGGNHRLKFNIYGNCSTASKSGVTFTVTGVSFGPLYQTVSTYVEAAAWLSSNGYSVTGGSQQLQVSHTTGAASFYIIAGDVELTSKPSWA